MTHQLTLRTIDRELHRQWASNRTLSFLQLPEWADVKTDWAAESVGWFDSGGHLVGVGLILYRKVPRLNASLAYLPEGPIIDWLDTWGIERWLEPLVAHAKQRGAFTVKIGAPVKVREWHNETLKSAIGPGKRLRDVPADREFSGALQLRTRLLASGWKQRDAGVGFGDVQPRYVFQIDLMGKTRESLLADLNQLWRRNLKKAEKSGVAIRRGERSQLARFHDIYVETANRDRFTPRPLQYFERMWDALGEHVHLYLAEIDGHTRPAAATLWVHVGNHVWYSYGASTTADRDARPSNAIQWRMLCDALDAGASVYDLRGISDTLDDADPLFGLLMFKLGTGGKAVELLGEFDYPIRPVLARIIDLYLCRR